MNYKTHIVSSLAITTPLLVYTGNFIPATVAGVVLGSILPDIDEPRSFIGSITRGISDLLNWLFGHRGITHSLLAFIIILIFCSIFQSFFSFGLALGYFLHLLEDSFSVSGIRWLQPFDNRDFKHKVFNYTTGGSEETVIFLFMIFILFIEVYFLFIS
jgi:inner membrane protein